MRWLDSITVAKDVILSKLQEIVKGREGWPAAVHGVAKTGTLLCNCTKTIQFNCLVQGLFYLTDFLLMPETQPQL